MLKLDRTRRRLCTWVTDEPERHWRDRYCYAPDAGAVHQHKMG
jgi:hypothetical protein